ncbi:DNA-binding protein [Cohnella lupini]|uniref:Helix-turn-helix protein n=1 Tax=Cohnella lupini TaxID=1294267 RepID=A0A3D9IBX8_9BACL|nr:DNA-binding protein [Cohnella lupini]RED59181.1 hypothetical protein DFP95_10719 [Cohnella lupini]
MKPLNITHIICSAIIGISLIAGSLIISNHREDPSVKEAAMEESQESAQATYKPLMTIEETAEYLNLSEMQVRTIISTEEATTSYGGIMFPMIRFQNETYVSTDGLKEWLKQFTQQRKQY